MRLILVEDIDAVRKYYPNITKQDFDRLIRLDPTFNENRDKLGTYGKWILNLFKAKQLDNEGHVTDVLTRFEENKNNLKDRDIGKFKSLEDLDNYLNDENNYKELSDRQELRKTQKSVRNTDVEQDAELVYEDEDWVVYVPKTYEASCKLGQGTNWCTATTSSDHYYKYYTQKGPLFININKHYPTLKYQFHFETNSFMNKNDKTIDIKDFILDNEELGNFYLKMLRDKRRAKIQKKREIATNLNLDINGVLRYNGQKIPAEYKEMIKKIIVEDGVKTLRLEVFKNCINLIEVKLPDSLKNLGAGCFESCIQLKAIEIPNNVQNIKYKAFYNCRELKSIVLGNNLINIEYSAFQYCKSLTNITIPDSVTSIGNFAFDGCSSLTNVTIPDSVISIGGSAFNNCTNLTKVNITSLESWCKINFISYDSNPLYYAHNLYLNNKLITDLIIPTSVTSISNNAFRDCTSLTSITIPDSVTSIGYSAFRGCSSLTSITIGNSVTSIGGCAFEDCSNLKQVIYKGTKEEFNNIKFSYEWNKDELLPLIKFEPNIITQEESLSIKEALNRLRRLR